MGCSAANERQCCQRELVLPPSGHSHSRQAATGANAALRRSRTYRRAQRNVVLTGTTRLEQAYSRVGTAPLVFSCSRGGQCKPKAPLSALSLAIRSQLPDRAPNNHWPAAQSRQPPGLAQLSQAPALPHSARPHLAARPPPFRPVGLRPAAPRHPTLGKAGCSRCTLWGEAEEGG